MRPGCLCFCCDHTIGPRRLSQWPATTLPKRKGWRTACHEATKICRGPNRARLRARHQGQKIACAWTGLELGEFLLSRSNIELDLLRRVSAKHCFSRAELSVALIATRVRFWHKADIPRLSSDVRFRG